VVLGKIADFQVGQEIAIMSLEHLTSPSRKVPKTKQNKTKQKRHRKKKEYGNVAKIRNSVVPKVLQHCI
jgi:hypothetical protein